jgi:hypothetical protein
MSTPEAEAPTEEAVHKRPPLARDLLGVFVPISAALHALTALPWHKLILMLFTALGIGSSVHWKTDAPDAPTVIPIDLDILDDDDSVNAQEPPGPNGNGGDGVGVKPGSDAGVDAPLEVGDDAMPGDASKEGGPGDAGGLATPDADAGDAPDGGKRIKDPNALAGGLSGLKPVEGEVNVQVLVRLDHLRMHPLGKAIGAKLVKIEQWKPFLQGTGIDPINDLDALMAYGPRFYETSRVTVILVHSKPDAELLLALKAIASDAKDVTWVGDDDVPAFRGKVDGAVRVFVQLPGGLIITPADGEKQALAIGHAMVKKHKVATDLLPKSDADLVMSSYMRKPSNVLSEIPEDLTDVHVTIRTRADDGAVFDVDAKAKDAKHATDDAAAMKKLIESHLTGLQGAIARKWIAGYTIDAEDDVVHLHHELSGEQVSDIWTTLSLLSGF